MLTIVRQPIVYRYNDETIGPYNGSKFCDTLYIQAA